MQFGIYNKIQQEENILKGLIMYWRLGNFLLNVKVEY